MPRIAVIAMGRWGGRELSYASDADAMFVMEDDAVGSGVVRTADPTKVAGAVITEMRRLLARPGADPALSIDADLRPEGKGGALIRSLSRTATTTAAGPPPGSCRRWSGPTRWPGPTSSARR